MALSRFWRRRLCSAKAKTPPPFGSGVQEIDVIGLEPNRQAARQQRSIQQQQRVLEITIHAVSSSCSGRSSQWYFAVRRQMPRAY